MARVVGALEINKELCKGCELCTYACSFEVLKMSADVNSKGYHYVYAYSPDACTGCTNCAVVCPDGVITVFRSKQE